MLLFALIVGNIIISIAADKGRSTVVHALQPSVGVIRWQRASQVPEHCLREKWSQWRHYLACLQKNIEQHGKRNLTIICAVDALNTLAIETNIYIRQ